MELIGPYLAASALLVVAGVAKALRPGDTARAAAQVLGGSAGRLGWIIRVGAAGEAILGAASLALVTPALAGAVAASYVVFAGFVLFARRRGGALATCGCFGTPDTAPTILHVAVDLGLALSAIWVAVAGTTGWTLHLLAGQPWLGIPLALASAVCAAVVGVALTSGGRLAGARRLMTQRSPG